VYIAEKLGIDVEKVSEARNVSAVVAVLNIDDQMELMSEENTLERVEKEDLIEKITQILNEFEERDQLIVQLYYYEELSLKEISEILQITESRISQIHKRLMEKIRKKLEGK
ncbi:sigma-70 family RNA polymerase sigma factor, partial [uncultured Campylobacter sp.]